MLIEVVKDQIIKNALPIYDDTIDIQSRCPMQSTIDDRIDSEQYMMGKCCYRIQMLLTHVYVCLFEY